MVVVFVEHRDLRGDLEIDLDRRAAERERDLEWEAHAEVEVVVEATTLIVDRATDAETKRHVDALAVADHRREQIGHVAIRAAIEIMAPVAVPADEDVER